MGERGRRRLALVVFIAGAAALLLAETTVLRLLSVGVLLAAVVLALFAIATPAFLEGDQEDRG